jgi:NAD-dependent dihydropyrimidine dehydrogenase PreA subunit
MAVLDKSISETCNGCGICVAICPQDVFRIDQSNQKALIRYLDDCVACGICARFCPRNCLEVTLERVRKAPSLY